MCRMKPRKRDENSSNDQRRLTKSMLKNCVIKNQPLEHIGFVQSSTERCWSETPLDVKCAWKSMFGTWQRQALKFNKVVNDSGIEMNDFPHSLYINRHIASLNSHEQHHVIKSEICFKPSSRELLECACDS